MDWRLAKVSFEDSCYCRAFSMGHLGVSFLDKVAKYLGFSESYFGYFCGSYLDLVLLDALASYLGYHIQEVLLEIQEVGHAHLALVHLVLERSDIMAGLGTYFMFLDRELVAACLVIMVVVALLVLSLQYWGEDDPKDNSD